MYLRVIHLKDRRVKYFSTGSVPCQLRVVKDVNFLPLLGAQRVLLGAPLGPPLPCQRSPKAECETGALRHMWLQWLPQQGQE